MKQAPKPFPVAAGLDSEPKEQLGPPSFPRALVPVKGVFTPATTLQPVLGN